MRRGRLLDEDAPDHMMAKFDCESLEEVFLRLSVQQEDLGVDEDEDAGVGVQHRQVSTGSRSNAAV